MKAVLKTLTLLAVASLSIPALSMAASKKAPVVPPAPAAETAAPEQKAKKTTYPLYGEVVSLDATTLVIKGGVGKPNRTFAITKDTKFVNRPKGGEAKPATPAEVKVGAEVGGLLQKVASGNDEVISLNIAVKQKEDKAAAPKKP